MFPDPEAVGQTPDAERLGILGALCGVRVTDMGALDLSEAGFNLKPWSWLLSIRREVATERGLALDVMFGYEPTQACLKRQHEAVLRARKKSDDSDGRWWMASWGSTNHRSRRTPPGT